jgi:hypothetical protein
MKHKPIFGSAARGVRSKGNVAQGPKAVTPGFELTDPLLLKTAEVCRLLGNIAPRTLSRLEARGLIRSVPGLLRHKLYVRRDVEALVENLSTWKP